MLTRSRVTAAATHPDSRREPRRRSGPADTRRTAGHPAGIHPSGALPIRTALLTGGALALAAVPIATPLYATGGELEDDSAVMIGSDGKIYALDLDSAEVSGGVAITGDTFDYVVTGLEADPVSNTLYAINQSATDSNVLAAIDYTTAESTLVEPDYGEDEILNALDRAEDGTYFLGHLPHDGPAGAHLSTLAVDSGNYSTIDTTDLAGGGWGVITRLSQRSSR
ncbi:hypothetical protein [Pontimonas sp.]|uniref:hypothetical protein n=1 Tax=Pontimonas sp. TaxID=2304492 RepID=UPI0028706898|nr:hypothetical protein [Pontimonas sp.]MDR9396591.1 hypothetical protein [Pontimonas sp.]